MKNEQPKNPAGNDAENATYWLNQHADEVERREKVECDLNRACKVACHLAAALCNLNEDAAKEVAEYQVPSDVRAALDEFVELRAYMTGIEGTPTNVDEPANDGR